MSEPQKQDIVARFSLLRLALAFTLLSLIALVLGILVLKFPSFNFSTPRARSSSISLLAGACAIAVYLIARTCLAALRALQAKGAALLVESGSIVCFDMQRRRLPMNEIEYVQIDPPLVSAELGGALHRITFHRTYKRRAVVPATFWSTRRSDVAAAFRRLGLEVRQTRANDQLAS